MNIFTKGFVLVGALGLSVACADGYDYNNPDQSRFQPVTELTSGFAGNMQFERSGQLEGEIGAVNVDSTTASLNGIDEGDVSYVEVMAQGQNGIGMNVLSIQGGLNNPQLQPGFTGNFTNEDYGSPLYVEAVGCSGDREYDWDYDVPADDVEIEVTPGDSDDSVTINYTLRTRVSDPMNGAPTGDVQNASGSFTALR